MKNRWKINFVAVLLLCHLWSLSEPERELSVTPFMLASAITRHKEIVYITLLILTISLIKKVGVYIQYILLWSMVLCRVLVK